MKDIIEAFEYYLKNTPKEQLLADWERISLENHCGPDVLDYLEYWGNNVCGKIPHVEINTDFQQCQFEYKDERLKSSQTTFNSLFVKAA